MILNGTHAPKPLGYIKNKCCEFLILKNLESGLGKKSKGVQFMYHKTKPNNIFNIIFICLLVLSLLECQGHILKFFYIIMRARKLLII